MMTSIEIPVGGSVSLIARKTESFSSTAVTQVGNDDVTMCAGAVATADTMTVSTSSFSPVGTSLGTTTLITPTCFIADSSLDTVVISMITAGAAIPANTAVTFTYASTGTQALTDEYHITVTTSLSVLSSAESPKAFNSDLQAGGAGVVVTITPSSSVTIPGQASSILFSVFDGAAPAVATNLVGGRATLYMPGFRYSIVAAPTVAGAASSASWDATKEVLTFTAAVGSVFSVPVTSLPAAGTYSFHFIDLRGVVTCNHFVIRNTVTAVTAAFSTPYTGAANSKLTFTFASSGEVTPSTAFILSSTGPTGGRFGPGTDNKGIETNPVFEAVSGFGTVSIIGAVYDEILQAITFSLGGSGVVAAGQLLTVSVIVSTMPAVGGDFFFTVSYGGTPSSSATTTVMGVISDVSLVAAAGSYAPAVGSGVNVSQTYTVSFTSSRDTILNAALGAV
jgi:hypothetical protein